MDIFNLYSDIGLERMKEFIIDAPNINNMRYTSKTVLITDSGEN